MEVSSDLYALHSLTQIMTKFDVKYKEIIFGNVRDRLIPLFIRRLDANLIGGIKTNTNELDEIVIFSAMLLSFE